MDHGIPAQPDIHDHGSGSSQPQQSQQQHFLKKSGADPDENGDESRHRRSVSGGLLGTLSFLRPSAKDPTLKAPTKRIDDEGSQEQHGEETVERSKLRSSLSNVRKRKGSLRKTALLGTGKMMRERRNSLLKDRMSPSSSATTTTVTPAKSLTTDVHMQSESPDDRATNSSSDSGWTQPREITIPHGIDSAHDDDESSNPRILTSPVGPYASTTDDDEGLTFFRPTASSSGNSLYNCTHLQPSASSSSLQRRRSNRSAQQQSLPAAVHTTMDTDLDDEWDYSETEWWGWVVLIVTWMVFVVGMGSCLDVWGWAWDVGETPYAPPELEDDPTLPITGYYPALMVCTAVMAWVWVVVAWVGMKYFRHAKVVGEEG